jgi:hypothetical protein
MKPLTRAWVRKVVKLWRNRLGLHEWTLHLDWDTEPEDGVLARVWKSDDYLHATIQLGKGWQKRRAVDMEGTLVHELFHVALRDLSRVNDAVFVELEPQAQRIAERAWSHAEEAFVDRHAEALVAAFGVTQP